MTVEAKAVNLKEVSDYIKQFPASTFTVYKKEMTRTLLEADTKIKTQTELKRRSGALMRSITTESQGTSFNDYFASIYTDMEYAPIQEDGGVIKAKKAYRKVPGGPYLNIPTQVNKTAAGVMRMTPKEVFSRGGRVVQCRPGKWGVILNGKMMFTLHKQVTIPARLHMVESVEDTVPTLLARLQSKLGE